MRVLLPYSERHFQRLDRLLQSSYLVEHTLASMQMLVAVNNGGGDSKDSEVDGSMGTKSKRPLFRELKRLRDGRRLSSSAVAAKNNTNSDVGSIDSGSEKEGSDGLHGSRPRLPPVDSEVVDGRVVFNVKLEANDFHSSDSEDESVGRDDDVTMEDRNPHGAPCDGDETTVSGNGVESTEKSKKKKRRKRGSPGAALPLGLVEEEIPKEATVPDDSDERMSVDKDTVAAVGGESSEKSKKKRRRKRASPGVALPADVDDENNLVRQALGESGLPDAIENGEGVGEDVARTSERSKKKKIEGTTQSPLEGDLLLNHVGDVQTQAPARNSSDTTREKDDFVGEAATVKGGEVEEDVVGGDGKAGKKKKKRRRKSVSAEGEAVVKREGEAAVMAVAVASPVSLKPIPTVVVEIGASPVEGEGQGEVKGKKGKKKKQARRKSAVV